MFFQVLGHISVVNQFRDLFPYNEGSFLHFISPHGIFKFVQVNDHPLGAVSPRIDLPNPLNPIFRFHRQSISNYHSIVIRNIILGRKDKFVVRIINEFQRRFHHHELLINDKPIIRGTSAPRVGRKRDFMGRQALLGPQKFKLIVFEKSQHFAVSVPSRMTDQNIFVIAVSVF